MRCHWGCTSISCSCWEQRASLSSLGCGSAVRKQPHTLSKVCPAESHWGGVVSESQQPRREKNLLKSDTCRTRKEQYKRKPPAGKNFVVERRGGLDQINLILVGQLKKGYSKQFLNKNSFYLSLNIRLFLFYIRYVSVMCGFTNDPRWPKSEWSTIWPAAM